MKRAILAGMAAVGLVLAAGAGQARELVYASSVPAKHPVHTHGVEPFGERLSKATDGKLTIKLFAGGSLASGKTTLNAIRNGTADMGLLADVYTPNELPTSALISDLAVLGRDARVMTGAVNQMLQLDCPACKKDYTEDKVLPFASYSLTPYHLMCVSGSIVTADDWKGKKVRGTGAMGVLAANMGATPVNVTSAEIYEALQRGQVDCAMGPLPWLKTMALWDMVTTVSDSGLGTYHGTNFINLRTNTWQKLSKKEKQAFVDNLVQAVVGIARAYEDDDASIRKEAEAKGIKWLTVDKSFEDAVEHMRQNDTARVIELAKSRGVKDPEPIVAKFKENIAKWTKIVNDINPGFWGDAEWAKYAEALNTEIYSKVSYP
ncbi:MAG: C4-dicarboxylate TRAP transporter substrate-binding protein [Alphaproteobacteria bacterium]|nr:C4-dicarboxylate TRAP transporter substrate-binding protein [Alphaproteobacteria bacterium]MCB9931417.1 C4-dicarboxylate TRAP transporter substrate-binding protein [Alphaproteobacteria bacterium]